MGVFADMTVFVRAVEVGSFSGAAQQLGIAKSIVSRRIVSLENRLGASVFRRTTRGLNLTETGQAYYERARRILADVVEAGGRGHGKPVGWRAQRQAESSWPYVIWLATHVAGSDSQLLSASEVDIELHLNDRRVDLVSEGFDLAVRIGSLPDSSNYRPHPSALSSRGLCQPGLPG